VSSGAPAPPQYQQFPPPQYPAAPPQAPSHDKPTAAMVLAIIGGVFILLGGISELILASAITALSFGVIGGSLVVGGSIGAVLGILIIVMAALLYANTSNHVIFGVLIIVFSVISLTSFLGGFVLGFILALIGGILAITWKPTPAPVYYTAPVQRMCPKCGRAVDPTTKFCPHCGNALP
jgi:hypothetical protein